MLELFDEFYCVASYLSITKAAAMLNMSQPNLSRHVRQLERETGFELLDRSSGCVKLTGAGRKLADGYPDIRRQLTELIEDCRRFAASPIKQITAHEPPYMDNVIGPYYEYLGKLNEQGARIEFRVLHRISLREALESRLIDVGVAYFYRSVPPTARASLHLRAPMRRSIGSMGRSEHPSRPIAPGSDRRPRYLAHPHAE